MSHSMSEYACTSLLSTFFKCINEGSKLYVKLKPCGHYFHDECIMRWDKTQQGKTTCPMCIANIDYIEFSMTDVIYLYHPCGHLVHNCMYGRPRMDKCPICGEITTNITQQLSKCLNNQ